MIHLGVGANSYMYDDFTQVNGTLLNSYGKWTWNSIGTAEVQSNKGRLTPTTSACQITSVTAKNIIGVFVRGEIGAPDTGTSITVDINGAGASAGISFTPHSTFAPTEAGFVVWVAFDNLTNSWNGAGVSHQLASGSNVGADSHGAKSLSGGGGSGKGTSVSVSASGNGGYVDIYDIMFVEG